MKTIKYIDINSTGVFHLGFNASSLLMMSEIYDEVIYYASSSSAKLVKNELGGEWPKNVIYHKIIVVDPKNKVNKLLKLFFQIWYTIIFIIISNKKNTIYFNYNPILSLPLINFLVKIFKNKVIINVHSEIDFLKNNVFYDLNRMSVKILQLLKSNHYEWAKTLYFCCLGEHIKKNAEIFLSNNFNEKLIFFEHTWIFKNNIICKKNVDHKNIFNIGFVGTISENKWLDSLIYLREKLPLSKYNITAIGRILCNSKLLLDNNVNFVKSADYKFISSELMKEEIAKQDYIVFLYPTDSFKLIASGSIFDAIDAEKYILALHNDCFDSLYNRAIFGELFYNIDDIVDYLQNYHRTQVNNLIDYQTVKYKLSPKFEAKKFKSILQKIKF